MSQELHCDWVKLLPLAVFRVWALLKGTLSVSPSELMYGQLVLTPSLSSELLPLPDHLLMPLLAHLRSLLWNFIDQLSTLTMCQPLSMPNQHQGLGPSLYSRSMSLTPFP